ncbi:TrkH family potassium uptake protein [Salisaeta longa]|uniref:TrkH family potassium uptake protein n=1 Tax=Salisaeta longa TaxID=503170 RepID=UPI0003B58487|nr:TrkH family potassium uptake protein [Salisaeta longa]
MATASTSNHASLLHRLSMWWRSVPPAQLFVGSFFLLIVLGTVGFKVLPGLYTGPELSWLNALFTSTSAVCVTGLIVVDTATFFTTWGQAYLLLLIQLGGLGIISFTSIIIVVLGRRLSLRHQALATGAAEITDDVHYADLAWAVMKFTLGTELLGAVLLYLSWGSALGWQGAVWPAVFHSISAFCNAGFSTFSTSLMNFQGNAPLLLVVMALIVMGGLGFLTLEELNVWYRKRQSKRFRLSTHSQIVLGTTAVLIVGGAVVITAFEWQHTLQGLSLVDRVVNGLFASVTTRTAGFNTIDYGAAHPSTNFFTILWMSIGGSPGSTAGGLKTTTAAILCLAAWARLRGYHYTHVSGRTIPPETVQRATSLFVLGFVVVTAGVFVLSFSELPSILAIAPQGTFLHHMFEAVSAFNTVGLSMGITSDLSITGRWTTILLMFIGRVGPLTVAAAMSIERRTQRDNFRYAYEDVIVG